MTALEDDWTAVERRSLTDFLFRRRSRRTHTYVCTNCYHLGNKHLLTDGVEMYLCRLCACAGGMNVALSKAEASEFDRRLGNLLARRAARVDR